MMAASTCVVYNPQAGRGRARHLLDQTRQWACPTAEVRQTEGPGHAMELARVAAQEGYATVVAAGGDGTSHEVANGLLQADIPGTALGIWPLGSSNDYAFALGLTPWWKHEGRGHALIRKHVDVGRLHDGGTRQQFYVNCAGVGFNGMVALESRSIRWLRGTPLYALAFLKAMAKHFRTPTLTVQLDDITHRWPTFALTVNIGLREGSFPITAMAKLDDDRFDGLHVSDVSRWELLKFLPALMSGNLPGDHPKLRRFTAQHIRVQAEEPLCIHGDGEFFCRPADGVTHAVFESLPKRLLVECAG